tara:strand:+ start:52085 stop:52423 length:339 start_codon:yes stop_codon:yes gene_type:complete
VLFGCTENNTDSNSQEIEFGASYSVVITSDLPSIENGILTIRVGYSGCNAGHSFEFKNRITNSLSEIWLLKLTNDQLCDAYFVEDLAFVLSESILNSDEIVLATPNDERISL